MIRTTSKAIGLFILFISSAFSYLSAQHLTTYSIKWTDPITYRLEGNEGTKVLNFEDAQYNFEESELPFYVIRLDGDQYENYQLTKVVTEKISSEERSYLADHNNLSQNFDVVTQHSIINKKYYTEVKIIPLRKNAMGEVEKLMSFQLGSLAIRNRSLNRSSKSMLFAGESKLRNGEWYKIAVVDQGIYKLTYHFLNRLGIDMNSIDPRSIKLYGYGGGMLPASNSVTRPDDMQENAIIVSGEQDGSFDRDDYILFYGEEQVSWNYDASRQVFRHQLNLYTDTTFYFIKVDGTAGKRITQLPRPSGTVSTIVSEYDDYQYHEKEYTNFLKSGSLWVGEAFDNNLNYNFSFNLPNTNVNEQGKIELNVYARSGLVSSFNLSVNGQNFSSTIASTNLNRYEIRYAHSARDFFDFTPNSGLLTMNINYNRPQSVAKGWLNSITVNVRRHLVLEDDFIKFRDLRSVVGGTLPTNAEFQIQSNLSEVRAWDITDKYNIEELNVQRVGANVTFVSNVSTLREYIAFEAVDTTHVYAKGRVLNQNLHALPQADMLIVSHPLFMDAANELADFRRNEGISTHVVTPQQIFNEFSSGAQDLIAIRSFIKMFYDRSTSALDQPKYLLMFGDASYDFKDRITGNTNFVPAFQSSNSIDPIGSYVSDDYFGLLDDSEGLWLRGSIDRLDIAIGRLPVQSAEEANEMVNKIKRYSSSNALRDWRNKLVFVGDDEDGVLHMKQSNDLSKIVRQKGKDFNNQKIFVDAYQQVSTASGDRYPQVTEDINQAINDGALLVNYTGHGGETGWAAERILGIYDITNWDNIENMPVFVTATCEFSRFDDPLRTSGGELALINPNGGGIGLMTTTRLVLAQDNFFLNQSFYNTLFKRKPDGTFKRLGEVFKDVKNLNAYSNNSRNFSLLADPALKLGLPENKVITTHINSGLVHQLDTVNPLLDTLNALSTVTIKGIVTDYNGNKLNNYSGVLYPTVFDKVENKSTLNNDGGGVFNYETQERRVFKGKATVTNGEFTFNFVVPKDISYRYGQGKISYYVEDGSSDGNGYASNFIIGGSNPNFVDTKQGPEMEIYMNDESFVYGGITGEDPILLVNLSDEQGINTVGSGIGHDLVAILDDKTSEAFILNDYYEASIDDYTKGTVVFPFRDLSEGKHTLRVKAWDVANNSTEKTIEFTVSSSKEIEIVNLVNYPNPFTTNTEFIFQHNQAGLSLDAKLEIFTVSGKLVKSIDQLIVNEGFISRDIKWDGRDDFGDKTGKGVYVYKLTIRSNNGSVAEKFEKLVKL